MAYYTYGELKYLGAFKFSKWFPHVGNFRVVKKKTNGELRLYVNQNWIGGEYSSIPDSRLMDIFLWLGRYLALKGKLPRHIALDQTAVLANRVKTQIREVIANEVYKENA